MTSRKKLEQPIIPKFDPGLISRQQGNWRKKEKRVLSRLKEDSIKSETITSEESANPRGLKKKLPHQKSIEQVIIDIRELIFKILEIQNSNSSIKTLLDLIMSKSKYQFAFCVSVISIGVFMLLVSNLIN